MSILFQFAGRSVAQRRVHISLTPDSSSVLDGYLPLKPDGRAVVILPGGGYTHLASQHEGHDWASFFNEQGIACFVLTYRMPRGDRSLPLADATNAMLHVRSHASEYGLRKHAIGIMGSSAGGHLATTIATHADSDARPDFQILFYPVITMQKGETHEGSAQNLLGSQRDDEQIIDCYSNERQVKSGKTPPAIIIAASDDTAVPPLPNAVAYYTALRCAGISVALHLYPYGGHGFGLRTGFAFHEQMKSELIAWLRTIANE